MVEGINENLKNQNKGDEDKRTVFEKELKGKKIYLEGKLVEQEATESVTKITEEDIKGILSVFKEYILAKKYSRVQKFYIGLR